MVKWTHHFELEGGRVKTNQSNETTLKVISIMIVALTDTRNNNLSRSKTNYYFKLGCAFHQLQNRNGTFLHKFKVYKTNKSCTNHCSTQWASSIATHTIFGRNSSSWARIFFSLKLSGDEIIILNLPSPTSTNSSSVSPSCNFLPLKPYFAISLNWSPIRAFNGLLTKTTELKLGFEKPSILDR